MQLKIIRGSTSFSIPTDKVRWTTKLDGAAILEFSSPWRTLIAAVGDRLLALSEDQAFFDGFVFQAADNGRQQTVLCYDRLKYLLYRDTKVFHNRTAAQIVSEILKERELPGRNHPEYRLCDPAPCRGGKTPPFNDPLRAG